MAGVSGFVTNRVLNLLRDPIEGLGTAVAAIAEREGVELAAIAEARIAAQSVGFELEERGPGAQYPAVLVYCDRVVNLLREKFRAFSGTARVVVEIRVSQDRLAEMERRLQYYVEAVTDVLGSARGDWGDGASYGGAFEATFGAAKHGGKNFIQIAKVALEVDVSLN